MSEPYRKKVEYAIKRFESEIQYLEGAVNLLHNRYGLLLNKAVEAHTRGREDIAKAYLNEISELKKMAHTLIAAQIALRIIISRLKSILLHLTDRYMNAITLESASMTLKTIQPELHKIFPTVGSEIHSIKLLIDELAVETAPADLKIAENQAKSILEESNILAGLRTREKLPEPHINAWKNKQNPLNNPVGE